MKILSWNLYNFFGWEYFYKSGLFPSVNDAKNFTQNRLDYFTKEIKNINPDVMYFYEVGDTELLKQLAQNVFGEVFYIFETTPDKRGIYNACVSSVKLNNSEIFLDNLEIPNFVITEQPYTNKYLVQRRGYIKTEILSADKYINIYAVHLKSQLPSRIKTESGQDYEVKNSLEKARAEILGEMTSLAEAYSLRKVMSSDIENKKEVIMLGDFNADFNSKRIQVLRGLEDSEDYMPSLFDFSDLDNYSYVYMGHKVLLDHAICSNGLINKTNNSSLHTNLVKVAKDTDNSIYQDIKILGSDHAPIVFDLNI